LEQQLGQHVMEAEDGGIAIKMMRKSLGQGEGGATAEGRGGAASERPIDVVLMDYMMPLMNGAAMSSQLHQSRVQTS
jgi:CheY-like chemotaxis protein